MRKIKNHSLHNIRQVGASIVDFQKAPKDWAEKVFEELFNYHGYHQSCWSAEQDIRTAIGNLDFHLPYFGKK